MKKYILTLLLGSITLISTAQVSLGYSIGYGTTDMKELSDYLERRVLETTYLGMGKVTKDLGNPVIHNLDVSYRTGKEVFGFRLSFMNTKAQVVYPALMGEGEENYTASGLRMGTFYRYHFRQIKMGESRAVSFYGEISPAILITGLKRELIISGPLGVSQTEESNSALCFSIQPFVGAEINVIGDLYFRIGAGYDLSVGGKIDSADKAKVGWSGLRAKCGISYTL